MNVRRRCAWVLVFSAVALPLSVSLAEETGNAAPEAQQASGNVDLEASRVYVRVGKRRLGHEHAVVGRLKSAQIDLTATENAGEIVFDMPTFTADTDEARKYVGLEGSTDEDEKNDVTKTMLGKQVLDVKQHPTATFKLASVKSDEAKSDAGHPQYVFSGDLTLRGKTQPVTFNVAAVPAETGKTRLTGSFAVKQTDFGIKPYSAVGGLVAVADELKIFGDLLLNEQP
jgi:polyisoprenoid-binding protein YceI